MRCNWKFLLFLLLVLACVLLLTTVSAIDVSITLNSNSDTVIPCDNINTDYYLNGNATKTKIWCLKEGQLGTCAIKNIIFNGTFIFNSTIEIQHCRIGRGIYVNRALPSGIEWSTVNINNMESYGHVRLQFETAKHTSVEYYKNRIYDQSTTSGETADRFAMSWENDVADNVSFKAHWNNVTVWPEMGIQFFINKNFSRIRDVNISHNFVRAISSHGIRVGGGGGGGSAASPSTPDSQKGFVSNLIINNNTVLLEGGENETNYGIRVQVVVDDNSEISSAPFVMSNLKSFVMQNNTIYFSKSSYGKAIGIEIGLNKFASSPFVPSNISRSMYCPTALPYSVPLEMNQNKISIENSVRASGITILRADIKNMSLSDNQVYFKNVTTAQVAFNLSSCLSENASSIITALLDAPISSFTSINLTKTVINISAGANTEQVFGVYFILEKVKMKLILLKDSSIKIASYNGGNTNVIGVYVSLRYNTTIQSVSISKTDISVWNTYLQSAGKGIAIVDNSVEFSQLVEREVVNSSLATFLHSPLIHQLLLDSVTLKVSSENSSDPCPSVGFMSNVSISSELNVTSSTFTVDSLGSKQDASQSNYFKTCPAANAGVLVQRGRTLNVTKQLLEREISPSKYAYINSNNNTFRINFQDVSVTVFNCSENNQSEYPCRAVAFEVEPEYDHDQIDVLRNQNQTELVSQLGYFRSAGTISLDVRSAHSSGANLVGFFLSSRFLPTANNNSQIVFSSQFTINVYSQGKLGAAKSSFERVLMGLCIGDTLNLTSRFDPRAIDKYQQTSNNNNNNNFLLSVNTNFNQRFMPPTINQVFIHRPNIYVNLIDQSSFCGRLDTEIASNVRVVGLAIHNVSVPSIPLVSTIADSHAIRVDTGGPIGDIFAIVDNISCWGTNQTIQSTAISLELDPVATQFSTQNQRQIWLRRQTLKALVNFRKDSASEEGKSYHRTATIVTHGIRTIFDTNLTRSNLEALTTKLQSNGNTYRNASASPYLILTYRDLVIISNSSSSQDPMFLPNATFNTSTSTNPSYYSVSQLWKNFSAPFYKEMASGFSSAVTILASSSLELFNDTTQSHVYFPRIRYVHNQNEAYCRGQKCFGVLLAGALNLTTSNATLATSISAVGGALAAVSLKGGAAGFFIGGLFLDDSVSLFSVSPSFMFSNAFPVLAYRINFAGGIRISAWAYQGSARGFTSVLGDYNLTKYSEAWANMKSGTLPLEFYLDAASIEARGTGNVTSFEISYGDRFERLQRELALANFSATPLVVPVLRLVKFLPQRSYFRAFAWKRSSSTSQQFRHVSALRFSTPQYGRHSPVIGSVTTAASEENYYEVLEDSISDPSASTTAMISTVSTASCVFTDFSEVYHPDSTTGIIPTTELTQMYNKRANLGFSRLRCKILLQTHQVLNYSRAVDYNGLTICYPPGNVMRLVITDPSIEMNIGTNIASQTSSLTVTPYFPPETTGLYLSGTSDKSSRSNEIYIVGRGHTDNAQNKIVINSTGMENVRAIRVLNTDHESGNPTKTIYEIADIKTTTSQRCCAPLDGVFKFDEITESGKTFDFINMSLKVNFWSVPGDSREVTERNRLKNTFGSVLLLGSLRPPSYYNSDTNVSDFVGKVDASSSLATSQAAYSTFSKIALLNLSDKIVGNLSSAGGGSGFYLYYPQLDTISHSTQNLFFDFRNSSKLAALFNQSKVEAVEPYTRDYKIRIYCPRINGDAISKQQLIATYFNRSSMEVNNSKKFWVTQCSQTASMSKSVSPSMALTLTDSQSRSPTPDLSASISTSISETRTLPPTPTQTTSTTFTISQTVTIPPTPSSSITKSLSISISETFSKTITPPPTPTATASKSKTVSLSESGTPDESSTKSKSLVPTPSATNILTETGSPTELSTRTITITPISLTTTQTKSKTETFSKTPPPTPSKSISKSRSAKTFTSSDLVTETNSLPFTRSQSKTSSGETPSVLKLSFTAQKSDSPTESSSRSKRTKTKSVVSRSANFTSSFTPSPVDTRTKTFSAYFPIPQVIIDVKNAVSSSVAITGAFAAFASPTAALDAARQITALELLECGGDTGNARYDVRAVVPFPLSVIPRLGFGSPEGYYMRGAILSHALLCLTMFLLCLLVGCVRAHWFVQGEISKNSNSPFVRWYLHHATFIEKTQLRIFFGKMPASTLLIFTVPVGQAALIMGTLIAAPSISSGEAFFYVVIALLYIAMVVYVYRQISGWVQMPDARGASPGAGSIFIMNSVLYEPPTLTEFQKKCCRFMNSDFGRWLLIGRWFWIDETFLADHYPRQLPLDLDVFGKVDFEQENFPIPKNNFLFCFCSRPIGERYGVLFEKFLGPQIDEELRPSGNGQADVVRSHAPPRWSNRLGWIMFFVVAFTALVGAILVGAARVRPQFCQTAAGINAFLNFGQFLFVNIIQPYIVKFRNVLAVVLEVSTLGSALISFAFLMSSDPNSKKTLSRLSDWCTWIATACAIVQLWHFCTRRLLMMLSGATMKTNLQLWKQVTEELDNCFDRTNKHERKLKKELDEKSMKEQELSIVAGVPSISDARQLVADGEFTNQQQQQQQMEMIGGVLLPTPAPLPRHLEHIHALSSDVGPRRTSKINKKNKNENNTNEDDANDHTVLNGFMKMLLGDDNLGDDKEDYYIRRAPPRKMLDANGNETNRYEIQPHHYFNAMEDLNNKQNNMFRPLPGRLQKLRNLALGKMEDDFKDEELAEVKTPPTMTKRANSSNDDEDNVIDGCVEDADDDIQLAATNDAEYYSPEELRYHLKGISAFEDL